MTTHVHEIIATANRLFQIENKIIDLTEQYAQNVEQEEIRQTLQRLDDRLEHFFVHYPEHWYLLEFNRDLTQMETIINLVEQALVQHQQGAPYQPILIPTFEVYPSNLALLAEHNWQVQQAYIDAEEITIERSLAYREHLELERKRSFIRSEFLTNQLREEMNQAMNNENILNLISRDFINAMNRTRAQVINRQYIFNRVNANERQTKRMRF